MRTLLLVVLLAVNFGHAEPQQSDRPIEPWPWERLFEHADLVVIACATQTADTNDSSHDPHVVVTTSFRTRHILKGDLESDRFDLLHLRLDEQDNTLHVNGPYLVSFRPDQTALTAAHRHTDFGRTEYLLFLTRRADGRYECVSGQIDPNLSVRDLTVQ